MDDVAAGLARKAEKARLGGVVRRVELEGAVVDSRSRARRAAHLRVGSERRGKAR
jgi:hypothetical protein